MEREESKTPKVLNKETSRRGFIKGAIATVGGVAAWAAVGGMKAPTPSAAAAEQKPPQMKYLYAQRENCTGCRACEYVCSLKQAETIRPTAARIHVQRFYNVIDVPVICWHCDDVPCIKACPTTPVAIFKDQKTNAIKFIDDKTCLGAKCNKCIEACPAAFLRRHPDTGWPMFCDLCDGDPECVKACLEQSNNPQGPCLRAETTGFGVNMAYRAVKPDEAARSLHLTLFYPNEKGERR